MHEHYIYMCCSRVSDTIYPIHFSLKDKCMFSVICATASTGHSIFCPHAVTPIPIVAIGVGIRHDYYGVRDGDELEV